MRPSSLPNTSKSNRTLYLDIARVIAIFLVCLNHAVNRSYSNYSDQMAEFYALPVSSTLFKTLCTVASQFGVPLFLMISGALLFQKSMDSPKDIKRFYKHNLLGIFITAEIWYVIIYWILVLFSPKYSYVLDSGIGPALWGMVKTMLFLDQVTFDGMWYIPMILCVYLTLPFLIIAKERLENHPFSPVVLLPLGAVYLVVMVLPTLNALLEMLGLPTLSASISEANLFPVFYLYIFAGYFVGRGCLEKFKTWAVAVMTLGSFQIIFAIQFLAYSQPMDYLTGYFFPLLPIAAAFLFELVRRVASRFQKLQPTISYLSRIAFGIYFLHIIIMTVLTTLMGDINMLRPLRLVIYQTVSFLGSIAIIYPLSKIPVLRKYMFMIK